MCATLYVHQCTFFKLATDFSDLKFQDSFIFLECYIMKKKLFLQAKCINSVDNPFLVNSEQLIYNFRQDCCKYFTEN